ncbi:DUF6093 family protein [Microbacterium sp. BG28]|uniref:DUF6093 family protein n=1 Tax=Microbacterium sp. BG28 TaxID=3097356 RepID=UPI002A59D442|nr:DUF6093 family protein [Microbacterium sp. BG28]MDY0828585.1 DUF6093 family protein [Microbacterium sp. BG28]
MSLSAQNRGRRAAEADMRDRCIATAATGGTVWDPVKLEDVPATATVYAGKCELYWSTQSIITKQGVTVEGYVLKVPVLAPALPIGALVRISGAYSDPLLVGREFVVSKLAAGSHILSRRYQVKEPTAPGG